MRRLASGLLVLMLVVFILARQYMGVYPWLSYVEAFAEAAMIGAIADWFAVTALFRHPLRLPIPHTAIIPRNKDRIGQSLGRFISTNFLDPVLIRQKLRDMDSGRKVAHWLAQPDNARFLAVRMSGTVKPILEALDDEHVRVFVRDAITRRLAAVEAAPLLARVLGVLVAHRHHQVLFDRLLDISADFLYNHREELREKVEAKSAWWLPKFVDEKIFAKIVTGIEDTLLEMRDPDHPWRENFSVAVEEFCHHLLHSPEYRARGEELKAEFLANPEVQAYLGSVWNELRAHLLADLDESEGAIRTGLERALLSLGRRLDSDPKMQAILNRWLERIVLHYAVPQRDQIGRFIAGVVERWDTRTLVDKLELQVGKDLQYIRINGTVVGGAVGLLIHALTQAIGWP
ncbi:DUF445 domain-containing protein [Telmatospirillum sp. J64-1]|uniref:DUF445 domain-containing protein n=1 Tax=Telmatospirillum sp. J64-1 TaxID=2502183 RepID=UPI0021045C54|nr:DUF445 domain-containing protein [Telmatospirillum sp. J64-1]